MDRGRVEPPRWCRAAPRGWADGGPVLRPRRRKVAVLARTQADLDATVAELLEAGARTRSACRPTSPTTQRGRRLRRGRRALGRAAQHPGERHRAHRRIGTFDELTDEDWLGHDRPRRHGHGALRRAALPLLRAAEWARIVNVSAHSTKRQSPGLDRLHRGEGRWSRASPRTCRPDPRPEEILVNTVSPGQLRHRELQGLGPERRHRRRRPLRLHARHRRALRPPGPPAPGRRPRRDRPGDRVRGVAASTPT